MNVGCEGVRASVGFWGEEGGREGRGVRGWILGWLNNIPSRVGGWRVADPHGFFVGCAHTLLVRVLTDNIQPVCGDIPHCPLPHPIVQPVCRAAFTTSLPPLVVAPVTSPACLSSRAPPLPSPPHTELLCVFPFCLPPTPPPPHPHPGKLAPLVDQAPGGVFLMAATLRPETMYGQTNCWALPEGQYGAFRGLGGEVYIMTQRSALNLSYQVRLAESRVGLSSSQVFLGGDGEGEAHPEGQAVWRRLVQHSTSSRLSLE